MCWRIDIRYVPALGRLKGEGPHGDSKVGPETAVAVAMAAAEFVPRPVDTGSSSADDALGPYANRGGHRSHQGNSNSGHCTGVVLSYFLYAACKQQYALAPCKWQRRPRNLQAREREERKKEEWLLAGHRNAVPGHTGGCPAG